MDIKSILRSTKNYIFITLAFLATIGGAYTFGEDVIAITSAYILVKGENGAIVGVEKIYLYTIFLIISAMLSIIFSLIVHSREMRKTIEGGEKSKFLELESKYKSSIQEYDRFTQSVKDLRSNIYAHDKIENRLHIVKKEVFHEIEIDGTTKA
ncbi:MAG: hypothetical protein ACRCWH_06475, partial [Aeromonas veronii]